MESSGVRKDKPVLQTVSLSFINPDSRRMLAKPLILDLFNQNIKVLNISSVNKSHEPQKILKIFWFQP